ncbi:MAG: nucleotidyltransferase family protein [Burkholderiaceae bacterium]|nr:nucleotidyltransferase family protein [Burkholderiaceae bacterium]
MKLREIPVHFLPLALPPANSISNMNINTKINDWIKSDPIRWQALEIAAALELKDWCLAAGFVRNLVWDKLHHYPQPTPLSDIDLIYFDPSDISPERDAFFETSLRSRSALNWSVKNQARMHLRNNDHPYLNTLDAMSYWVEIETAVGVQLSVTGELLILAPFGLNRLSQLTITLNDKRPKPADFYARITEKRWLEIWPQLKLINNSLLTDI